MSSLLVRKWLKRKEDDRFPVQVGVKTGYSRCHGFLFVLESMLKQRLRTTIRVDLYFLFGTMKVFVWQMPRFQICTNKKPNKQYVIDRYRSSTDCQLVAILIQTVEQQRTNALSRCVHATHDLYVR
jgi:hypothetical protein